MRPATKSALRKRLADYLVAQTERERATDVYKAAAKALHNTGDTLRKAREEVAGLLKAEPGAVTYEGHVFRLDARTQQLIVEPLARDLQPKQEALPLGSTAAA